MKTKEDFDNMTMAEFFNYLSSMHKISSLILSNIKKLTPDSFNLLKADGIVLQQIKILAEIKKESEFATKYIEESTREASGK